MKLDRIDDFASELSSNLLKSMVLPGGLLGWLARPLTERIRKHQKAQRAELAQNVAVEVGQDKAVSIRNKLTGGPVVLLGGYPVPDEAVVEIIYLSGGRSAKVAVIPVAAHEQPVAGAAAMRLLTRFGMRQTQIIEIQSRDQANDPALAKSLAGFDAIVLCGESFELGYQRLHGTACDQALSAFNQAGKLIVGLSGGAGLLAEQAVVNGGKPGEPQPGLSIIGGLLVEAGDAPNPDFAKLIRAFDRADSLTLAAAIHAGTAVVFRTGDAKVLGDVSVTFLDAESGPASGVETPRVAKVLVLETGHGFNLVTRRPISPSKDSSTAAAAVQVP